MLHLPAEVWIEDAAMPYDQGREIIELVLSGPDFPVVPEGEAPPLAEASVKHIAEQYEWDWGLTVGGLGEGDEDG